MKKVAILTINNCNNYGNRLQNFATQEILKTLGFEVDTVVHNVFKKSSLKLTSLALHQRILNFVNLSNSEKITQIKRKLNRRLYKLDYKRMEVFKEFTKKHINETTYSISENNIPRELGDRYDFFVTGSDQVWNPELGFGDPINFITFAPKHKRIAYTPSFGMYRIPNEYVENYTLWLKEMKSLSVREEAGAEIIKELTGRDALVLVDPTLVLSKEKWLSISKTPVNKPQKPYLLTYFFGGISEEIRSFISKIISENNLEIVNLVDYNDKSAYIADPSEFLDYINSASLILTNSFHGTVFSILFKKAFIVFNKFGQEASMNSRIDTLLSTFKLENRRWGCAEFDQDIFSANYSHINDILEKERKKTFYYLKKALELERY